MEKEQKDQGAAAQEQQGQAGKNPTLNEKGSSVPDYGNVMGGTADENASQGHKPVGGRQETGETLGNP